MRTTLDIDPVVLAALKERQRRQGGTLGALVSELLAGALAQSADSPRSELLWPSGSLGLPLIDIDDKDALWAVLDA